MELTKEKILEVLSTIIEPDLKKDLVTLKMIKDIEIYNYVGGFISQFEIYNMNANLKDILGNNGVYFIVIRDTDNHHYFTKYYFGE